MIPSARAWQAIMIAIHKAYNFETNYFFEVINSLAIENLFCSANVIYILLKKTLT